MRPPATFFRTARLLCVALVATLCVVAAPGVAVQKVRAAGAGTVDYFVTTTTSNYFNVAENSTFDNTGDFTYEVWVKPDNTCVTQVGCMFVNKESSWEYGLLSGELQYALTNSGGAWNWYGTGFYPRVNAWTHIALTVQRSTNTLRVYVNGNLFTTIVNSTTVPSVGNNANSVFTIGGRSGNTNTTERFSGSMDEVRIYSNVRSQANIQSDMNTYGTAAGADTTGLTVYYDFNAGSGSTLANDAPGAAAGTTLTAAATPTWTDVKTTTTTYASTLISFQRSYIVSSGGWTVPANVAKVEALIVGGGGGAGDNSGGGGSGGGVSYQSAAVVSGVQSVVVGTGGLAGTSNTDNGKNGGSSGLGSTTVAGGNGGISNTGLGGASVSGSGAGGRGSINSSTAGTAGSAGPAYSITGTSTNYAGGGGGGGWVSSTAGGAGGAGGGGAGGGSAGNNGSNGTDGLGGGGGSGSTTASTAGSGIDSWSRFQHTIGGRS